MDNLDAIFSPQSLAVKGAPKPPGKVGHDIFINILKGGCRIILKNPAVESPTEQ